MKDELKEDIERSIINAPARASLITNAVGRRAEKVGGSYQALGTIVADFTTVAGKRRLVFEFDAPAGMLHIFDPAQLMLLPPQGTVAAS